LRAQQNPDGPGVGVRRLAPSKSRNFLQPENPPILYKKRVLPADLS
jgi:hypothetical protein